MNLLKETVKVLEEHDTSLDRTWFAMDGKYFYDDFDHIKQLLDRDYHHPDTYVDVQLMLVGPGWYMTRSYSKDEEKWVFTNLPFPYGRRYDNGEVRSFVKRLDSKE